MGLKDSLDRHLQPTGALGMLILLGTLWSLVSGEPLIPSLLSAVGLPEAAAMALGFIERIPARNALTYTLFILGVLLVTTVMWRTRRGAIDLIEAKARLLHEERMREKQGDRRKREDQEGSQSRTAEERDPRSALVDLYGRGIKWFEEDVLHYERDPDGYIARHGHPPSNVIAA